MQYRKQGTKTKLYRAIGGNRWKMLGSMPTNASTIEEVPEELIKQLDARELKNLHAWLRGAAHRVAREAAKGAFDAMQELLKRADAINDRDRAELCRIAWQIIDAFGGHEAKNRSA